MIFNYDLSSFSNAAETPLWVYNIQVGITRIVCWVPSFNLVTFSIFL